MFLRGRRESDETDDEKYSAMPHTKTTDKLFIIEPQAAQAPAVRWSFREIRVMAKSLYWNIYNRSKEWKIQSNFQ